jgi:hypothetical protein
MHIPTTKYKAISTGEEFVLKRIIDSQMGKKLTRPIYEFEYINRDYGNFTCYLEDVERSMYFCSWVKI